MKKYILILVVVIFYANAVLAQPTLPTGCDFCEEFKADGATQEQYEECRTQNNCPPTVPINSNKLILFALALSFGSYSIYKTNKKRRFEN